MGLRLILSVLILSTMPSLAQESLVGSISDGSCWYKADTQTQSVKVASFNGGVAYQIDSLALSTIEDTVKEKLKAEFTPSEFKLSLHCGSYGSSVVVNFLIDKKRYCAWYAPSKEGLALRTFGATPLDEQSACDGFKIGELVIALESDEKLKNEFLDDLEAGEFKGQIESFEKISSRYIKVKVADSQLDNEEALMSELESHKAIRRVERNSFYHPVGEFRALDMFSLK